MTSPSERHLVLEAPNAVSRRALLNAIKNAKSHIKAHVHLSPEIKANKTLVYYEARKNNTWVEDHGDIITVAWRFNKAILIRIDLS